MAYLYGDSTESPLDFNYIEFLRDALDFAVEVLMADHRVLELVRSGDDHKRAADSELAELRQLSDTLVTALEKPPGGPRSAAFRCAVRIRQAADDAIKLSVGQVKQGVAERMNNIAQHTVRERQSNLKALERLLTSCQLPDSSQFVELTLNRDKNGYDARARGRSDIALDWIQALDIPADHLFGHLAKVENLVPNLEIKVPEKGGWMRKGMRLKSHRISSKYITELVRAAHQTTLKLRAAPEEDQDGYNILITEVAPRVRLVRVQTGGEHSPPFEPVDEDVEPLLGLARQLCDAADELARHRGALIDARFDNISLVEHEQPSALVKRLISKIAPVVREIAKHSLSPDELVLKQVLADDRREEVFASKADLLAKIDPVPLGLRGVFAPLGLGDLDRSNKNGDTQRDVGRPSMLQDDTVEVHMSVGTATPNPLKPPRPGPTLPPLAPPAKPAAKPSDLPVGTPGDDDVTFVGPNSASKSATPVGEDSIDIALNELERES